MEQMETPEINPYIYHQLIYSKNSTAFNEQRWHSVKSFKATYIHIQKGEIRPLSHNM